MGSGCATPSTASPAAHGSQTALELVPHLLPRPPRAKKRKDKQTSGGGATGFRVADAVMAFHQAFDLPRRALPTADVGESLADLRVALLEEEHGEFVEATEQRDLVAIADALGDIVYVAYGAAVTYGIDLDAIVAEIHRANMSKLDERGRPVKRADGKVLKSARYRPPDVRRVLDDQLPLDLTWPASTTPTTRSLSEGVDTLW